MLAGLVLLLALWPTALRAQTAEGLQAAKQAVDAIQHDGVSGPVAVLVLLGMIVIVVVLGSVIRALWQALAARDAIIAALQDKRAEDAGRSSKLLAEVATTGTAALANNTAAQAVVTVKVEELANLVRPLGPEHGRILTAVDRNADKVDEVLKAVGQGCRA